MKKEAFYYKAENGKVKCLLCPQGCILAESKIGFCRVRKNEGGKLYTLIYGECSSVALDPIEKKPLFHFFPGRFILSLGTLGCNFHCNFCQNWHISQSSAPTRYVKPEKIVELAKSEPRNIGIAYTYNEPIIWYEFVLDTAKLAHAQGLKNVLVTNGFINSEPLEELLPYIDAMNIDVKASQESFYKRMCKGQLAPVMRTAERAKRDCLIEITNLIIPTVNDSEDEIRQLIDWVVSLGVNTPLHFSRYFPHYKLDLPPTPVSILRRAREMALGQLKYVYIGNVWGEGENTFCPHCQEEVISRSGFDILEIKVEDGKCKYCGGKVDIVGV